MLNVANYVCFVVNDIMALEYLHEFNIQLGPKEFFLPAGSSQALMYRSLQHQCHQSL